jgi:four helix bundle protein
MYADPVAIVVIKDCGKVDAMGGWNKTYRDLDAWNMAMSLVEATYEVTKLLPVSERYNLISQMQKAATSIPSNIAEGQGRGTVRFGLWFLRVAIGSLAELDTQVELARRLRYVTPESTRELDSHIQRVRQMLYGMRREHERRLGVVSGAVVSTLLLFFVSSLWL